MTIDREEFEALMIAAIEIAESSYLDAVASNIEGRPDPRAWRQFELASARSYFLAKLTGISDIHGLSLDASEDAGSPVDERRPKPVPFVRRLIDRLSDTFATRPRPRISMSDFDDDDFISEPFIEALQGFEQRIPMLADQVKDLAREAKAYGLALSDIEQASAVSDLAGRSNAIRKSLGSAFWVSDLDETTIVSIKELIAGSLRGTSTPEQIGSISSFIDAAELSGAQGLTRARLETVYRTNLQTAYNDGQMDALGGEEVKKIFPLVEISEIDDNRSREIHAAMDGYINTRDYFIEHGLVVPNGFNCRGSIIAVTNTRARSLGLLHEDGTIDFEQLNAHNGKRQQLIDSGLYPDEGFALRISPAAA